MVAAENKNADKVQVPPRNGLTQGPATRKSAGRPRTLPLSMRRQLPLHVPKHSCCITTGGWPWWIL